jgi:hypothetical protein
MTNKMMTELIPVVSFIKWAAIEIPCLKCLLPNFLRLKMWLVPEDNRLIEWICKEGHSLNLKLKDNLISISLKMVLILNKIHKCRVWLRISLTQSRRVMLSKWSKSATSMALMSPQSLMNKTISKLQYMQLVWSKMRIYPSKWSKFSCKWVWGPLSQIA